MASQTGKGLTPKREKFAQLVASGMQQADAYRKAFDTKQSKDKTVHEGASRLAADSKVAARIEELRAPVIQAARYGLKEAMDEADLAITLAKEMKSASALVAAVQLKAKLNGLLVEDRGNKRRPYEDLDDQQLERALQDKAREAGVRLH
jgi:phage terminase small subunit